ncbi:hypothetical protein [Croceicoccus sp. Ery15]|uniref:hypothetical protein n=1 Tax=Croceicoccus sp. Ery15 TaxID=1703338 RepID=UPI001E583C9B|nr:hypothetical protein [Croceicoccus sp. Ery15]
MDYGSGTKRTLLPRSALNYEVDPESGDVRVRPRDKLLERLPVTEGRGVAFDLLQERLAVSTEFFQHHGDGGRYGVYRAMTDLIDYLTSRGMPHATVRPIEAVMEAIVDADNGRDSAIFRPARTSSGGTPPKSVMQLEFEGKLAIVTECCVRHCRHEGMRPFVKPGTQLAAKLINESCWGVRVTAAELKELRERIHQRKDGKSPDRMEVDISMASELARSRPLEWAKILLAHEWVNPPAKVSE